VKNNRRHVKLTGIDRTSNQLTLQMPWTLMSCSFVRRLLYLTPFICVTEKIRMNRNGIKKKKFGQWCHCFLENLSLKGSEHTLLNIFQNAVLKTNSQNKTSGGKLGPRS